MRAKSREDVKILIEISMDAKEADEVINENYNFKTVNEKVAFLKGMFDFNINGYGQAEPNETTYLIMLEVIINTRGRC